MRNAAATSLPTADAREQLAQTRRELLRHMQQARGDAAPDPVDRAGTREWDDDDLQQPPSAPQGGSGTGDDGSTWQHLRHSLGAWWHAHPAHLALEVARPVCEKYARDHPMKVVGLCAATGALLVLARPWRLISITGLLVAALKSTQMSALAAAMLRSPPPKPRPPSGAGATVPPRPPERKHP